MPLPVYLGGVLLSRRQCLGVSQAVRGVDHVKKAVFLLHIGLNSIGGFLRCKNSKYVICKCTHERKQQSRLEHFENRPSSLTPTYTHCTAVTILNLTDAHN